MRKNRIFFGAGTYWDFFASTTTGRVIMSSYSTANKICKIEQNKIQFETMQL